MEYLQGINFSQLTLAEKTEIKDLSPVTPDFVISHSPGRRANLREKI